MSEAVADYGWRSAQGTCASDYIAPQVLAALRRLRARHVLDLGAGNGDLCARIARAGFDVAGVEYDGQGVAIAQRSHPALRFYRHGVQDDPAALLAVEQPFDVVVSTEVIEHLFAPHLLPLYAARVLAPGGHLLITTPFHGYLKNLALALTGRWDHHHTALWHGGHIKFFSRRTLTQLVEANGFEVTGFEGVGRLPQLWKSMLLIARLR